MSAEARVSFMVTPEASVPPSYQVHQLLGSTRTPDPSNRIQGEIFPTAPNFAYGETQARRFDVSVRPTLARCPKTQGVVGLSSIHAHLQSVSCAPEWMPRSLVQPSLSSFREQGHC